MTGKLTEQITRIVSATLGSTSEETAELIEAVAAEISEMDDGIAETILTDPDLRTQFVTRVQGDLDRGREQAEQAELAQQRSVIRAQEKESLDQQFETQLEQTNVSTESRLFIPQHMRK